MAKWEEFEIQCTNFLNKRFGAYAQFIHYGGSDSTIQDILVRTSMGKTFYIDAKHSPAQCGQFVLLPQLETRTFVYSPLNGNRINIYAEIIMNYMNGDFDTFRNSGTTGKSIEMPNGSDIFANWIIQTYIDKGTYFFITNNFTIVPIKRFRDYFDVSAKYRKKKSGSSNVGKRSVYQVMEYIKAQDYSITNTHIEGDKLFAVSLQQLHNQRFMICGNEYMFSLRGNVYEIRKLNNHTNNANVIFSIKYKSSMQGISDTEFIAYLSSKI